VNLDAIRVLAARIDRLEKHLRRSNPEYARVARLERVTLGDVDKALRPVDALVEYVRYRRYDFDSQEWKEWRYGAFVLRDDGRVVAVDLGEAEVIDESLQVLRGEVIEDIESWKALAPSKRKVREAEAAVAEHSSELRARVWQPLEKHLKGVRRVYLAPDGMLGLLPFEALAEQTPEGDWRYLAEEHELVYVGTGRDLARLMMTTKRPTKGARTAVLIGNPDFSAEPGAIVRVVAGLEPAQSRTKLAQAPATSGVGSLGATTLGQRSSEIPRNWDQYTELKELVDAASSQLKSLGWTVPPVLSDEKAVEEVVYGLRGPRILQIATHGYLLGEKKEGEVGWDNPLLRSTLMLAGVNKRPEQAVFYRVGNQALPEAQARTKGLTEAQLAEARIQLADGVLTAYEVTGLDLTGTEFVNLTACETGLGEVTTEGVVGLRQAFLLAGARSLTTSMWEVPASETIQQIQTFYHKWLGDRDTKRYKAFRTAQLEALQHARESLGGGHPFYWAGVVFVGDPGDLPARSK
jgi:CHAT domain-containing protein